MKKIKKKKNAFLSKLVKIYASKFKFQKVAGEKLFNLSRMELMAVLVWQNEQLRANIRSMGAITKARERDMH